MISRWEPREPRPARPLSNRVIALSAVIVLGIGAVAWTVLLWRYGGADPGVELDAIRTAGTLIVGAGGAAALLLAARRSQSTERTLEHQHETLEHQREVARAIDWDAVERRITELYTRAVEQLGAEKAPVRLGGLHALERLAQNNSAQRQTIVDVICSYLRMPFTPPDDQAPGEGAPEDAHRRYEQRRQELQVRLTAQRILSAHLKPETAAVFWDDIDLNLAEAHLHEFDLSACHVRKTSFDRATFAGKAGFCDTSFASSALFDRAKFTEGAWFVGAKFTGNADFRGADFIRSAEFLGAKFTKDALFVGAKFTVSASFSGARFTNNALFDGAMFLGYGRVSGADFSRAPFGGMWGLKGRSSPQLQSFSGGRLTLSQSLLERAWR